MGHHRLAAVRIQRHLADRQRSADLDELTYTRDRLLGGRPAQKVDVQTGRHRQRHDANRAENGDVECHVGHRHEQGTADRVARPQMFSTHVMDDRGRMMTDLLDDASGLRELTNEEIDDFGFGCQAVPYRAPPQNGAELSLQITPLKPQTPSCRCGFHAMAVRDFTACRSNISRDAGLGFCGQKSANALLEAARASSTRADAILMSMLVWIARLTSESSSESLNVCHQSPRAMIRSMRH